MVNVKSAVGAVMDAMVYAVSDGSCNEYYLIDIGDAEAALSLLPSGAEVKGVFITHGHHDHIFGLSQLKKAFPECEVYASAECAKMLASAKANLSAYVGSSFSYDGKVTELRDGDSVQLYDGIWLRVIETPGHNPSCLCFIIDDYIFTGDSYIPGAKIVTNLPGGNKKIAQESFSKIMAYAQGKKICPGHQVNADNAI